VAAAPRGTAVADALTALAGLGFRPMEASRAVAEAEAELGAGADVSALIRVALRKSAK
jgi:Holliday junction DNA helicase RuvA